MSASLPVTPQRPRTIPTVSAPRRNVAGQLLKKTGLIRGNGEDVSMKEASSSKPQHRSMRSRTTMQAKAMEAVKGKAASMAMQRSSASAARGETPPTTRGPVTSRIPKRPVASEASVVETWKKVVSKRYNAQNLFLNLDNLAVDEDLAKAKITITKTRESREVHVIMKIASQLDPPPITISIANNGFDGSVIFGALNRWLPNVVNLSLIGNKVRSYRDMEIFGGPKWILKKLREIILLENPLHETAVTDGKVELYRNEIARKFPSLEILDNIPLPHIKYGVAPTTPRVPLVPQPARSFPTPMRPSAVAPEIGAFISNFLESFLDKFDNSRPSLHTVYTPQSTFSFSYDSTIPPQARQRGFMYKMPNQRKLDWKAWHGAGSRNLMKTHNSLQDARDKLYTGADDIVVGLSTLPTTKHIVTEGEKFVLDVMQLDVGAGPQLLVTVHGEFVEEPGTIDGIRSFDRTLVLAPAPDNSVAKINGWEAVVISDQLNIRAYSSHDSWTIGPLLTQQEEAEAVISAGPSQTRSENPSAAMSDVTGSGPGEVLHPLLVDLADSQRAAMTQLKAMTGLNYQYAMMCLEANGWDIAQAKSNFDELVNSIPPQLPPEAWIES
ncbi:related to mRNA export factor mex67 [Serendipita indica DSM 11827]|uniref:Related to mRNA export factor mex67 n=1 Tax=Serendipita indica (strain DSM 11827) TaxID=1109443 RepID=G4T6V2_SERID|nr:related to mRNA export factor mex67 [Serendipita indica DSM 11827]